MAMERRTSIGWELQLQMQASWSISRKYESGTIEIDDDTPVHAGNDDRDTQGMYLL